MLVVVVQRAPAPTRVVRWGGRRIQSWPSRAENANNACASGVETAATVARGGGGAGGAGAGA